MSFLATIRAGQSRRRQRKREARAEERAFVSVYDRRKKNKPSQLLLLVGMGASVVGASLIAVGTSGGVLVGFVLVGVGVPLTVAAGVWALKNWEY